MASITEISDRFVEEFAALDPQSAARMMGIGLNASAIRDYSPDGTAAMRDVLAAILRDLEAATPTSESERLGRCYLESFVSGHLGVIDAGELERDLSIIGGPASSIRMSFDLAQPERPEDWENVALRMEKVPAAITGYRASLRRGLEAGRVASRRCAIAVAGQCEVWAGGDEGGWFSSYAASRGEVPFTDRLREAARAADAAYGELATWLRRDYAPAASEEDGVGEDAYRAWARYFLGGDLDVDDAYSWGWDELGRIEAEQAAECTRILPGAGFAEVRQLLNTAPDRAIEGVDAWRGWLQEVTDRAVEQLEGRHFDIAPPLRTCVVSIPPEGSGAAPYYTPPSDDLAHPGRIWFPTLGRTRFPTWDGVTTVFHEAVPGHHLQLGATRLVELTRAQRLGFNSAHGEGWALYAERFMDELGSFERPEYRLGFLSMQALRAARVVVDIGVHTHRPIPAGRPHGGEPWSFEAAVACIEEASGLSRDFCESEVLRYLAWPTQATCYKLGERVWLAGREDARRRSGERFDLKAWHGSALALGPLGIDDLADELGGLAG